MTINSPKKLCTTFTAMLIVYSALADADVAPHSPAYFAFSPPATDAWYVDAGIDLYGLNILTHRLPMTLGDWYPTIPQTAPPQSQIPALLGPGFEPNSTANLVSLGIGYNLSGTPFLPRLFTHESVEINYSQFNRSTSNYTVYSGATGVDAGAAHGVIWQINDSIAPIYDGGALRIVDSNIHSSVGYKNAEIHLKGQLQRLPGNMQSTARVGLIATNLNQRYYYSIDATTQGITHDPKFTLGNDTLYAQYAGFAFGNRFDLRVAPAFSVFIDGTLQILYVTAALVANETPDALAAPNTVYSSLAGNVRLSDYDTSMSYRAKLSAGVTFYPGVYKPNSPKVSLGVGVDQWGYVPQEITITGPNSEPPHIVRSSMRNYFAALNVSVPIG